MSERTWQWSTSTLGGWAMRTTPPRSHETIQQVCRAADLAGIEGNVQLFADLAIDELEAIGRSYREAGLAVSSFHLPFSATRDDIASFYETPRRIAVDTALQWMERAAALGAKVVVEHPTVSRFPAEVDGVDRYLHALDRSLKVLLPRAEALGLTLALENMVPGPEGGRFGSKPGHVQRMLEAFDHAALGFCLDTGHAQMSCAGGAPEMLEVMKPRLAAFHIVDNAGDRDSHLAPGHGRVDWNAVFQAMAEIGYDGVACIETPPFAPGPDYSPEAFGEMVRDTDLLVEAALGVSMPAG